MRKINEIDEDVDEVEEKVEEVGEEVAVSQGSKTVL